ncbi:LuxR family transcriptional regulator, partial [Citrobacter sp. AAK_AS5]
VLLSPQFALALSTALLVCAFGFALKLPSEDADHPVTEIKNNDAGLTGALLILCLFIAIITIDSGLMYQVVTPAFSHL